MGHQAHAGGPGKINNSEIWRPVDRRYAGVLGFTQLRDYPARVGDGGRNNFSDSGLPLVYGFDTILDEFIFFKHASLLNFNQLILKIDH